MQGGKLNQNSSTASHAICKLFVFVRLCFSDNKLSPGGSGVEGEQESGAAAGRKRRWGSSTAVTAKKPSISITTDSLKVLGSNRGHCNVQLCLCECVYGVIGTIHVCPPFQSLIPDIRPCLGQEAVVDLHPEEAVLSGIEDEERERSDQDLQIRRTVTQVAPALLPSVSLIKTSGIWRCNMSGESNVGPFLYCRLCTQRARKMDKKRPRGADWRSWRRKTKQQK